MIADPHNTILCAQKVGWNNALDEALKWAWAHSTRAEIYPENSEIPDEDVVISMTDLECIFDILKSKKF